MNKKLIPPYEKTVTNGKLATTERIEELYQKVNSINNRKLNISYSIPAPGSTFPFTFTRNGTTQHTLLRAVDIDTEYTNGNISLEDVHKTFRLAFSYYSKLFKHDASGFELELTPMGDGYENISRTIEFDRGIAVGDNTYMAGDIHLIFADFYPASRLANAWSYYNPYGDTVIGGKTNAGLTIIFNTNSDLRMENDPAIFDFPQVGRNNLSRYRYSLLWLMVHELGHVLGASHFPHLDRQLMPSVMNASLRGSVPFEYIFPNKLWNDYWIRATFSSLYNYDLNHILAGNIAELVV